MLGVLIWVVIGVIFYVLLRQLEMDGKKIIETHTLAGEGCMFLFYCIAGPLSIGPLVLVNFFHI